MSKLIKHYEENGMTFKPTICVAMLMAYANPVLAVNPLLITDETILTAPQPEKVEQPIETITTCLDTLDNGLGEMSSHLSEMIEITKKLSERELPPTLLELEAKRNG